MFLNRLFRSAKSRTASAPRPAARLSVYALVHSEHALAHRQTLIEAAEMGDFWGWGAAAAALPSISSATALLMRHRGDGQLQPSISIAEAQSDSGSTLASSRRKSTLIHGYRVESLLLLLQNSNFFICWA